MAFAYLRYNACLILCALFFCAQTSFASDRFTNGDRDLAKEMLRLVAADVNRNYYDSRLHGVDWDATVRKASDNIDKADSMSTAMAEIAAALDTLNDSHTFFVPPPRPYTRDLGVSLQFIGPRCYVVRVKNHSDAEKKGLKPGLEVLAINGVPVSRVSLWRMFYIFEQLQPLPGLRLTVMDDKGQQTDMDVMAKTDTSSVVKYPLRFGINQWVRDLDKETGLLRARCYEKGEALLIVKFPRFAFTAHEVDGILARMRKHRGVVFDLRNNPGGLEDTLTRLLGGLFENDFAAYERKKRNSSESVTIKGRHHDAFIGRLAVLIDSESASASELFARIIQLQKRGFVVGDRSAGMVMESQTFPHEVYLDSDAYYGSHVTKADLIMTDGKSLEKAGVEPDIVILPSPADLASKQDPVMAKAAGLVGAKMSPEEAGSAFPPDDEEK